jgi:hypothetical protein
MARLSRPGSSREPAAPAGGALAAHLEGCAACADYARRLADAVGALADHHAGAEPDAAFAARVVTSLPARDDALGRAAMRLLPAALALVLVLAGLVVFEERRRAAEPEDPGPTDDPLAWVLRTEENGS